MSSVPLVDSLVLGDSPHLVAHVCAGCGAKFTERRNGCASCGGTEFSRVALPVTGTVRTYSIVYQAPPGVPAPYISCVVDLDDGTRMRSTLREVEADPAAISTEPLSGLAVKLVTFSAGTDSDGTEALGFAFAPLTGASR